MIVDLLKTAVTQNLGVLKSASKGWQVRNCMLCHTQGHGRDTRNRFGIQFNADSIIVHCFNCSFSANYTEGKDLSSSFKFFLGQIGVSQKFIKEIEFEIFKQAKNISSTREGDENRIPFARVNLFQNWQPMKLPEGSLTLQEWAESGIEDSDLLVVMKYAASRKLYDFDRLYWTPLSDFQLNRRLIVPYYHKSKIVGFTGRIVDHVGKDIPKYYQKCPPDFVYNLDNQHADRKFVIVNEGVLDAYAIDGVSTLGEISQHKIAVINRLQKSVVVCPDRDKKGRDLVDAAIDNGWAVSFPPWPQNVKDASHAVELYGRLMTTATILSSAITGKEKILLRWEIEQNARERQRKYNY